MGYLQFALPKVSDVDADFDRQEIHLGDPVTCRISVKANADDNLTLEFPSPFGNFQLLGDPEEHTQTLKDSQIRKEWIMLGLYKR